MAPNLRAGVQCLQLRALVADVPQALLDRGDFSKPLVSAGFSEPVLCVGLDGVQARRPSQVEA